MKSNELILVLEDDRVDALALTHAFRDAGVTNSMHICASSKDALAYLLRDDVPLPGLILLDLNLPGMSGLDFLRHIKGEAAWRRIPVIVLTTSNEERDRHQAFDLSAAGYIVKPMNYDAFVDMIRAVASYWLLNESPN